MKVFIESIQEKKSDPIDLIGTITTEKPFSTIQVFDVDEFEFC